MDPEILVGHARFVRSVAFQLIRDEHMVDDLVQETMLIALEKPPRAESSARSWLRTVTLNAMRISIRRDRRRVRLEERVAREECVRPEDLSREKEQMIRAVVDAVFSLKEPYRSTMVQRYYENLTPSQIAEKNGVPVETVRSRLKRSLQQTRRCLDRRYGQDRSRWVRGLGGICGMAAGASSSRAVEPGGRLSIASTALSLGVAGGIVVAILFPGLWRSLFGLDVEEGLAVSSSPQGFAPAPSPIETSSEERLFISSQGVLGEDALEGETPQIFEDASSSSGTGVLHLMVQWGDGSPAEGVCCGLAPLLADVEPQSLPGQDLRYRSGPDGRLVIDGLASGAWLLAFDRSRRTRRIEISSGRTENQVVRLPEGLDVRGVVVDEDSNPVPEAEILLASHSRDVDSGVVLGHSRFDGTFLVRDLSISRYIGARSSTRGPSWMIGVRGEETEGERNLRLELTGSPASLIGSVSDQNGEPISKALVVVEEPQEPKIGSLEDGTFAMVPAPRRFLTDSLGRFRVSGLSVGRKLLYVVDSRGSCKRLDVDLHPEEPEEFQIVLANPGVIRGRVVGVRGVGVEGAKIFARDRGWGPFRGELEAQTEGDGLFVLQGVSPGKCRLRAEGTDHQGMDTADLEILPGEEIFVELKLGLGAVFRGTVVDEGGRILEGARVRVTAARTTTDGVEPRLGKALRIGEVTTDGEGSFLIANRLEGRHRLSVYEPKTKSAFPILVLDSVLPGNGEMTLRVPDASRGLASVRGRLESPAGDPTPGRFGLVEGTSFRREVWVETDSEGKFAISGLPSGIYDLLGEWKSSGPGSRNVERGETLTPRFERKRCPLGRVYLSRGEKLDLKSVVVAPTGRFRATLSWDGTVPFDRPFFRVWDQHRAVQYKCRFDGDQVSLDGLVPGSYFFTVIGIGATTVGTVSVPFEVLAGRTSKINVALQPGKVCRIRFLEPNGERIHREIRVEVSDDQGEFLYEFRGARTPSGKLQFRLDLVPGRYGIRASGPWGLSVDDTILVPEDHQNEEPFVLEFQGKSTGGSGEAIRSR